MPHTPLKSASPSLIAVVILGLSVLILCGALIFEHVWGYAPCSLCLEQRTPWVGIIALCAVIVAAPMVWPRAPGQAFLGIFVVVFAAALYNAGLGVYHAGIEWAWWQGPPGCTGTGASLDPTKLDQITAEGIIRCDEAAWRDPILKLSMAGYNAIASLIAATLAEIAGWRLFHGARLMRLLMPGLRQLQLKGPAK